MPAMIVGSAHGRSISVFTKLLPWKSSRTSVQASIVPVTALIATTAAARPSVSSRAAFDSGFQATCQKWCQPPWVAFTASAASGTSTTTLRYPSATPLLKVGAPRARRRTLGNLATSTASGDPQTLLDLRDDSVRRIEEPCVHAIPAADVADLEEPWARRKLLRELPRDIHVDRPEAVLGPDRLRRRLDRKSVV